MTTVAREAVMRRGTAVHSWRQRGAAGALLLAVGISPSDDDLSRRHRPRQAERLARPADHDETASAS